ncbi:MAG: hypothetical protein GY868_10305 [Deltaproteobacteria bacterium]|nr:hypothetical protein [Deltaproteobacteria bacterium]
MMTEEYTFPAYEDRMMKIIEKFGAEKMETYKGVDIRPLWDMKGGGMAWSYKYLFAAPKLEKIIFSVQSFRDKLMCYTTIIWPKDEYALPVYSSFWAESAKGSYMLIDLYPLADLIVDLDYLEHYMEPLEDAHAKGAKNFPERPSPSRDPNWWRAMSSPYAITADFAPSTSESQENILSLAEDYLNVYCDLWQKEEVRDAAYLQRINERKQAIRQNLKDKDPGGVMLENSVGHELTELTLTALF